VDAIANIKLKIIKDFDSYLKSLNIGLTRDYSGILHEISFVQSYQALDKIDPVYEYLSNN